MNAVAYNLWSRFLNWFGKIELQVRPPKIRAVHIRQVMEIAQRGDIICHYCPEYADAYFIPGKYSHSGVVIDNQTVVHAVAEGVCKVDILDFMEDCDGVILLRPNYPTRGPDQAVDYALRQLGKPYNYLFDNRKSDTFYCHELSMDSAHAGGVDIRPAGPVVLASDLIRATQTIYEAP